MESSKLIATFEIPQYLREIEVSAKQRPKYYTWDGTTIKAKNKKLLQKYINKEYDSSIIIRNGNVLPYMLKYPYFIVEAFNKNNKVTSIWGEYNKERKKYFHSYKRTALIDTRCKPYSTTPGGNLYTSYLFNVETKKRVLANETQVGKPKKIIIKGQDMYSGVLNEFTRAKIVNELKQFYADNVICDTPFLYSDMKITTFPVRIEMELIDTIKDYFDNTKEGDGRRWDVGNRCYPYLKTFVDFLVENEVLPDDDRLHVIGEGYFFTSCERFEDRKLIFRIYSK